MNKKGAKAVAKSPKSGKTSSKPGIILDMANDAAGLPFQELEALINLLKKGDVAEFEWKSGDGHIRIGRASKGFGSQDIGSVSSVQSSQAMALMQMATQNQSQMGNPQITTAVSTSSSQQTGNVAASTSNVPSKTSSKAKSVKSPLVGTYYSAPSPGADVFIKVGQTVKKGDTLCIVEAMKLMNEIEAEFGGKVVAILTENGQPVEYDEVLFEIEPN